MPSTDFPDVVERSVETAHVWYYEGWKPGAAGRPPRNVDAFLEHVAAEGRMAGAPEASLAVGAVTRVLRSHVSEGEMDDVVAILPAKLKALLA